ncbi:MAG: Ldh family oxidoreductase [Bacillota bacterium]
MPRVFAATSLKRMVVDVLTKLGVGWEHASTVADVLVSADLRGVDSHGVARLPIYCRRIKAGAINTKPSIRVVNETPATAVVDGDNGFGHVAGKFAMDLCIRKAREHSVAVVGVRNSNHFGIGAYYAMMALAHNMIGFAATNASPLMAPFGGSTAMLGTNPFCLAVPAGKELPLVLDMATSQVARGKIEMCLREGKKIPLDWALDQSGKPTDDPAEALKGTLLPLGGHKGYGLSMAVDLLCGLMVGAAYLNHVGSLFGNLSRPQNVGHLFMALDVSNFMPVEEFETKMDEYLRAVKASPRAQGVTEIFVPGEIEFRATRERLARGIPIKDEVIEELQELLHSEGLDINEYCGNPKAGMPVAKPKVLITEPIDEAAIEGFKQYSDVTCAFDADRQEVIRMLKEYDAMVVRVKFNIDREMIDSGSRLRVIAMNGIGLNHIDVNYATLKGIAVLNVPDASIDSVAELAIGLMIALARKVVPAFESVRRGEWNKHAFVGTELAGKTLGIIALGKIGSRVAKVAQAMGMNVVAHDPYVCAEAAANLGVKLASLDELLSVADVISIHAPLTPSTFHLINREALSKAKRGVLIINTGRGAVVDEEALYEALKAGHVGGFAADVMEVEPPGKHKLFELPNVVVTPHVGGSTSEAQRRIGMRLVEDIGKVLLGT